MLTKDLTRILLKSAIIIALIVKVECDDVECDGKWEKIHRACYMFIKNHQSYAEAQQTCNEKGGMLISVNSIKEFRMVRKALQKKISSLGSRKWWVGLHFIKTDGVWKWEDGAELNVKVTKWAPGEPNNGMGHGDEFCSIFSFNGKISDERCEKGFNFICEMNKITVAPTSSTTATPLTTVTSTTTPTTTTDTTTSSSSTTVATTTVATTTTQSTEPTTVTDETRTSSVLPEQTDPMTVGPLNMSTTTVTGTTFTTFTTGISTTDKPTQPPRRGRTHCPRRFTFGSRWPKTPAGTTVSRPCKSGTGVTTWRCGKKPVRWIGNPDTTSCVSKKYEKLIRRYKQAIKSGRTPVEASEAINITSSLVEETSTTEQLSTADISASTNIIKMVRRVKPKNKEQAKLLVKKVIRAGSILMKKTKISKAIRRRDRKRMALNLLSAIEDSSEAMAEAINVPTVVKTKSEEMDLELHVVNTTTISKELVYGKENQDESFSIPLSALKAFSKDSLAKVVFMTHHNIGEVLSIASEDESDEEEETNEVEDTEDKLIIASNIISASIGSNESIKLQDPVTFTMKHLKPKDEKTTALCSFWNFSKGETGNWSQDGCSRLSCNSSHTVCQCDHLTNFAILFDYTGVELSDVHSTSLRYITYIGCIVSLVALFTSWLTFICLGPLQNERNSIHKNLVFCLFAAEVIFLIGINQTDQKVACAAIALLLHFFFLSAFAWMMMEAIHIVVMLVQVFDTAKSKLKYYYLASYGVPVTIVATTAGIDFTAYGTDKYCWLSTDGWFIWSFIGPVAAILVFNTVVLTFAMVSVCRHSEYVFAREKSQTGNFKSWIQGALALEVLLGLTWTFGYFFINEETVVLAYIFTIFNSLQGLFIFIFHCLLSKKVRNEYKKVVRMSQKRRLSRTLSTTKSACGRKNDGSYELCVPVS